MITELQHQLIFKGNSPEQANLVMLSYTARMPCKEIVVNGELYLRRYFMCEHPDGAQEWIHQFVSRDGDRHLHSHPWHAVSTILVGEYLEEYLDDGDKKERTMRAGDLNILDPGHIHRIASVSHFCWTHMVVGASRLDNWFFLDDEGNKEFVATSPSDWWKDCKPRGNKDEN